MQYKSELTTRNFWIIALNSLAGFILAYIFLFYLNHISIILTAGMFDYDLSFDYRIIFFHIEPYEWTADAVKLIFSAGPVLIFVCGLISLVAFFSLSEEVAVIKIFFLWFAFLSLNYFFGGLMIGNIFRKGVGHVFNWMYLNDTQKMIIAIVGFFGLLSTGILMAKPVAHSANSYFNKLGENNFPFFFTAQIIVPFILGNLIMFAYFFPDIFFNTEILFYERFGWMSLALIFILVFGRMNHFETIYFDEDERNIRLSYTIIFIATGLLIGLRLLLSEMILLTW
jgi:hypothetical protein